MSRDDTYWTRLYGGVGEANTGSNKGSGIGAFDSKVGIDLVFRSFLSSDSTVGLALDTATGEIDVTVDESDLGLENKTFTYSGSDLTRIDYATSGDYQTFSYSGGNLSTIQRYDILDNLLWTKTLTYTMGNLTQIEVS